MLLCRTTLGWYVSYVRSRSSRGKSKSRKVPVQQGMVSGVGCLYFSRVRRRIEPNASWSSAIAFEDVDAGDEEVVDAASGALGVDDLDNARAFFRSILALS